LIKIQPPCFQALEGLRKIDKKGTPGSSDEHETV
jgi:hypothetical protein